MANVESTNEKQNDQHHKTSISDKCNKNNEFSEHKNQQIRKISTQQSILKSLGRIGICLNDKHASFIQTTNLEKVCFILINIRENDDSELGFGSLNDGYIVALKHHRNEFNVFYLYNPSSDEFSEFFCFFLKNVKQALTVFYSGIGSNDKDGIEFKNDVISKSSINKFILQECEVKKQVLFITDCIDGGTVFDIRGIDNESNLISFSVTKSNEFEENKRPHGIFTYYFCKITSDFPNITPCTLIDRMNPQLQLFNQVFSCQTSKTELFKKPIFF